QSTLSMQASGQAGPKILSDRSQRKKSLRRVNLQHGFYTQGWVRRPEARHTIAIRVGYTIQGWVSAVARNPTTAPDHPRYSLNMRYRLQHHPGSPLRRRASQPTPEIARRVRARDGAHAAAGAGKPRLTRPALARSTGDPKG